MMMSTRLTRIVSSLVPPLLAAVLAASGCAGPPKNVRRGAPDIILVSIDSLRRDHLGCYGHAHPTSPTIDRLAAGGVVFDQAVSTTSWTLPAHAALFTGLDDSVHGLVESGLRLSEGHITLAEVLREGGYQTAGFYGGPFLHPTFGLSQGFDHYQSCMTRMPDDLPEEIVRAQSGARRSPSHADITGPRTVDEIENWLQVADDRPMFLFVHLWDVHYDYIPPAEYLAPFEHGYRGSLDPRDFMLNDAIGPDMPEADLRQLLALYDGEIRFTDAMLGRILDLIARRGRLEDSVLVVTSDHGDEFFEHGAKGHQHSLYDELLRIPLIVYSPTRFQPRRIERDQVSLIDVMPTLLAVAGIGDPPSMQGRDLSGLLSGRRLAARPALSELHVDGGRFHALRTPSFKVIDPGPGFSPAGFDLVADPGERDPLPVERPEVREALSDLAALLEESRDRRNALAIDAEPAERDEEMLRRLRSLGYVGSPGD